MMDVTLEKRARATEQRLQSLAVAETAAVDALARHGTHEYLSPDDLHNAAFTPCDVGYTWPRDRQSTLDDRRDVDADVVTGDPRPSDLAVGQSMWFRLQCTIPDSMAGRPVYLEFEAQPRRNEAGPFEADVRVEGLCYRDGQPWQAFDNGHTDLLLTESADGGEQFDLLIEVGSTTLWGNLDVEAFVLETARLYAERESVSDLYQYVSVLNDLWQSREEGSPNRGKLLRAIAKASYAVDFETDDETELERSAENALATLREVATDLQSELSDFTLVASGHAHIDLAWLWPWSETVRKGGRSFATMLELMAERPDFEFIQSQPHLYEFMRHAYPDIDERIADRVESGQWHPTGALWVEADVNISGGEALARQFLLGKRYFRERFDVDPTITFIPDVFGYSAALPGIAQAADCPYFFTQKMSWNEVNDFPHHTFTWEGIDGSSVLAHFPPAETYNGMMTVEQVRDSVTNFAENDRLDTAAYLFGWGDGGGGPTRDMLDRRDVIDDVGSLPNVEFGSLRTLFDRIADAEDALETWSGELYLEKHRGTLTTQATTKHNNRRGEFALRAAELWSALAHVHANDFTYSHDALTRAWTVLLFQQFHDILPGSSIPEVYADADRDYATVFETADAEQTRALEALASVADAAERVAVTNALSWERSTVVELDADDVALPAGEDLIAKRDGERLPVQRTAEGYLLAARNLRSLGVTTVELEAGESASDRLSASSDALENEHLRVEFDDDGTLSVYDKDAERAVLDGGGNDLRLYRDQPAEFDAWDVEGDVYAVGTSLPAPETVDVVESGPVRATVRQVRTVGDSRIEQSISLTRDSERLDVRTTVDWQEDERLLKAHFPIDVRATSATYEVQYGHYERPTHDNTTWDRARFEEPHQKWVDVADREYGAAVLNDGKYGVHVDGADVSLTLLRAPDYPDPAADRGTHEFTYSLYPHTGEFTEAGVIEHAYDLNAPAEAVPVAEPVDASLCSLDADGVIVEAVKRAEDDPNALIVRLYEAWGRETTATLAFEPAIAAASTVNLIEDHREDLAVDADSVTMGFDAFEIKSLRVTLADEQ